MHSDYFYLFQLLKFSNQFPSTLNFQVILQLVTKLLPIRVTSGLPRVMTYEAAVAMFEMFDAFKCLS
jgi:hypothetical protein